jgi:hypothetical protein
VVEHHLVALATILFLSPTQREVGALVVAGEALAQAVAQMGLGLVVRVVVQALRYQATATSLGRRLALG